MRTAGRFVSFLSSPVILALMLFALLSTGCYRTRTVTKPVPVLAVCPGETGAEPPPMPTRVSFDSNNALDDEEMTVMLLFLARYQTFLEHVQVCADWEANRSGAE